MRPMTRGISTNGTLSHWGGTDPGSLHEQLEIFRGRPGCTHVE
jgi:hypothetical protein